MSMTIPKCLLGVVLLAHMLHAVSQQNLHNHDDTGLVSKVRSAAQTQLHESEKGSCSGKDIFTTKASRSEKHSPTTSNALMRIDSVPPSKPPIPVEAEKHSPTTPISVMKTDSVPTSTPPIPVKAGNPTATIPCSKLVECVRKAQETSDILMFLSSKIRYLFGECATSVVYGDEEKHDA